MSLNLSTDLRDAARSLRKQPRFLVVAALTLALGIGAVTSIFSVVNGVLFTPLPYPHGERLVNIWSTAPGLGYNQFAISLTKHFNFRKALMPTLAVDKQNTLLATNPGQVKIIPKPLKQKVTMPRHTITVAG